MRPSKLTACAALALLAPGLAALTGIAGAGAPPAASGQPPPASSALLVAAGRGAVIPPRVEEVEHMCAMVLGCQNIPIQIPTTDFGVCVRHFWDQLAAAPSLRSSLTIRECGLGAVSCGQFSRCALRGAEPTACAGRGEDGSGPVGRCDISGRALQCLNGRIASVRDCPRGGELCAVRQGEADCVAGRCTDDDGKPTKPACSPDKTRITHCKNGRTVSLSCSALGLTCDTNAAGEPVCVPEHAPRCSSTSPRCDRSTAIECLDGREVRTQCDKANLVCGVGITGASRVGACAVSPYSGSDEECDPNTFRTRCVGNQVEYCAGGVPRKYECRTYFGLNRCVGRPGEAHCAP